MRCAGRWRWTNFSLPGSGVLLHASPGASWHFSLDLRAAPRSRVDPDTPGPSVRCRDPLSSSPALLGISVRDSSVASLYHPHLQGEPCKLKMGRGRPAPVSIHHRQGSRGRERPVTSSHTGSRTQSSQILLNSRPELFSRGFPGCEISAHLLSLCPEVRWSDWLWETVSVQWASRLPYMEEMKFVLKPASWGCGVGGVRPKVGISGFRWLRRFTSVINVEDFVFIFSA